MFRAKVYFYDTSHKLRAITMDVAKRDDLLFNICKQQELAYYIEDKTGVQVTLPIMASIK